VNVGIIFLLFQKGLFHFMENIVNRYIHVLHSYKGGNVMQIECTSKNKNLVVKITGEIDHHTSEAIREKIDREYQKMDAKNIIFDFDNIQFMDSSGIGVLMGRFRNIQNVGGKVGVIHVKPQIDRVFQLSGLYKIIPSYGNLDEAITSLQ
jgi:stage II sporulation protein AA (anti-sigma F factor antagonist)